MRTKRWAGLARSAQVRRESARRRQGRQPGEASGPGLAFDFRAAG